VTSTGRRLPADLVVLGLGVRPNVALAQAAGIPLGGSGGIAVDARMRTAVPGVWAAGDCVESVHRLSGQRVVVALGTHANKQGRVVGINLGGGYATFPGVIGTAVTKVCDLEVARTGLSEAEATAAGYCYVTASVDSTTRAGYFPGAKPIRVKLTAEKRSGRLLGAQIAGREGAAKRIDVLATAIWNEMSVDEVLGLDLSYAPPFAPVWDLADHVAGEVSDQLQLARLVADTHAAVGAHADDRQVGTGLVAHEVDVAHGRDARGATGVGGQVGAHRAAHGRAGQVQHRRGR
jgi:pyruvate/2-oxoglutarate dehydrogenase complex dihydrolipoamide dehydrogenase (E3) component